MKKFCWTGCKAGIGLVGGDADSLTECDEQARVLGLNTDKDEYYKGETPEALKGQPSIAQPAPGY